MAGYRTPLENKLAEDIKQLKKDIVALNKKSFRVPVLDVDPDTTDPTNLWLLQDGRLRCRNASGTIKEFTPAASAGGSTSGTTKPPVITQKTYTRTDATIWSQSYNQGGTSQRSTNHMYYGYVDGFNQLQMSMAGWGSYTSILSGATVKKVELYLSNLHAWYNSGVTIKFGWHAAGSAPSNYAQSGGLLSAKFGKVDDHWLTLPLSFGNRLKAGTARGITLYQTSTNVAYYGYAEGDNDDHPPKLRITYTK